MKRRSFVLAALLAASLSLFQIASALADVRLPAIFGDGMVLQQKQPIPVWGWAEKDEKVTVALVDGDGKAVAEGEATADADGRFMIRLPEVKAGGPFTLKVKGNNEVARNNVLVGEVWVCSGQSNMQWNMAQINPPAEEVAAANYPKLRVFQLQRATNNEPQADCTGEWVTCTPQTLPHMTAVGFYFGRKLQEELGDVPVGLISTNWGGTVCEAWTSREALEAEEELKYLAENAKSAQPGNPNFGSVLYNGMIHPIVPYGIRGAIWYQGESNVSRAAEYARLFPVMIADWRKQWGQGDFPFLFVQLAPFRYGHSPEWCAELWEAQLKTLKVPNTGMAVTTDIGDVKDIHPRNKRDVGHRLALWALAKTYDKPQVYSGPLYKSMEVDGDAIRIKFDHIGGGLKSRDDKPLTWFTIAGADQKFVPAVATIEGDTLVVKAEGVASPVAVRFAWDHAAEPNLCNAEGLPASPFRTDDFPLTTKKK